MIDLYAAGTSNGMRARIALEECGLKYNWHPIDLTKGEHKTPQYLALNPMGQIPVIVDNEGPGGKKITLSQSSAIMVYCAEKAGKFIPKDPAKKAAMLEAYMSASTDITPGFGSINACVRAKDPAPYAVAGEMFKQRLGGTSRCGTTCWASASTPRATNSPSPTSRSTPATGAPRARSRNWSPACRTSSAGAARPVRGRGSSAR